MRFVRRSWGWYFTLWNGEHFKIKILRFKKYSPLSLQYHTLRSELWLFLSGNGVFTEGTTHRDICKGDYAMINQGVSHSYRAVTPTTVLEVQFGKQCIEEDIVRL